MIPLSDIKAKSTMKKVSVTITLIFTVLLAVHGAGATEDSAALQADAKAAVIQSNEALAAVRKEAENLAVTESELADDDLLQDLKIHFL